MSESFQQVKSSVVRHHVTSRPVGKDLSLLGVLGMYSILVVVLGIEKPGLQYDEALFSEGAVQMLVSRHPPAFVHSPAGWLSFFGQPIPLMTVSYAGALKNYLLLPFFATLGTAAWVSRFVSALLGAIAIYGAGRFAQSQLGALTGTIVALGIAVHPGILQWTLYDNTGLSLWFALEGALLWSLSTFIQIPKRSTAIFVGLLAGLAIWSRVNFVWLLLAGVASLVLVNPRSIVDRKRYLPWLGMGLTLGVSPLLLFELRSGWETLKAIEHIRSRGEWTTIIPFRLRIAQNALLYDNHRIAIWGGPPLPDWQIWLSSSLIIVSVLICLIAGRGQASLVRWRRGLSLTLLFVVLLTLTTPVNIAQYHFVGYLPLAIMLVVLAINVLSERFPVLRLPGFGVAVLFLLFSVHMNFRAARGLDRTEGIGPWSSSVDSVSALLVNRAGRHEVAILDWGFSNNLFVLSGGRLELREKFAGATIHKSPRGVPWTLELRDGRFFLLGAGTNVSFPEAGEGLRQAASRSSVRLRRTLFVQTNGEPYAELFENIDWLPR